jgi:homoserine O-succinyltransferase
MPILIDNEMPARVRLENENIFVMDRDRAHSQRVRPLKVLILNLMPTKEDTEAQLLRLLSNSPLQVDVDFLQMATHTVKNASRSHMEKFYNTFDDIREQKFDGMIITGAPVEELEFEDVDYWDELTQIMEWSKTHIYSVFHICWGAQAGLYYHYGIQKKHLEEKMFGVFPHYSLDKKHPLMRGFDDVFYMPHSRHTTVSIKDVSLVKELQILAVSDEAGVAVVSDLDCRMVFVTGHMEYERETLAREYFRDKAKGLDTVKMPVNYFPNNDTVNRPMQNWRSTASLMFYNWLNYFVYQKTPYDLSNID